MNKNHLQDILRKILSLSERAGIKLLKFQKKIGSLHVAHKKSQGVVSTADTEVENFLLKHLDTISPKASILAEEDFYKQFKKIPRQETLLKSFRNIEYAWAIDPLDGTTNFLNGMDYFCICISLLHYGTPILGVVHRPSLGEFFYALKGHGGFKKYLGKRPKSLFVKKNSKQLSNALVVTGFSSEKGDMFNREFDILKKIVSKCRGIRRMGSAALDLCYVAEGMFDCFWEKGLAPWDVSAAGLICLESGVHVTDYKNIVFHPFQDSVIACRRPLYDKVARQIL